MVFELAECSLSRGMEIAWFYLEASLMSGSQYTAMLRQADNITAAELRGYFLRELPKLTDAIRARCERYIESLTAFERGECNSTHPASTTLQ